MNEDVERAADSMMLRCDNHGRKHPDFTDGKLYKAVHGEMGLWWLHGDRGKRVLVEPGQPSWHLEGAPLGKFSILILGRGMA